MPGPEAERRDVKDRWPPPSNPARHPGGHSLGSVGDPRPPSAASQLRQRRPGAGDGWSSRYRWPRSQKQPVRKSNPPGTLSAALWPRAVESPVYLRVKVESPCHAPSGVWSQATLRDLALFFCSCFLKPAQVQGVVTVGFGATVEVPRGLAKVGLWRF